MATEVGRVYVGLGIDAKEFSAGLKQAGSELKQAQSQINNALSGLGQSIGAQVRQLGGLGQGAATSKAQLLQLSQGAATVKAQLNESGNAAQRATQHFRSMGDSAGGLGGIFGKAAGAAGTLVGALGSFGLAAAGVQAVVGVAKGAGDALGLGLANQMEQTRAQMMAFYKDAGQVEEILKMVKKEAASTPFAFTEIASAASLLGPVAKNSGRELIDVIRIAEALSASNPMQGFEGAVFSLKEAVSGDMASIIDRFNLSRSAIKKYRAEGMDDLQAVEAAMRDQGITYDLVAEKAKTMSGRWSTFLDTIDEVKLAIATPIFDALKESLTSAQGVLERLLPAFKAAGTIFGTTLAAGVRQVTSLLDGMLKAADGAAAPLRTIFEIMKLASGTGFELQRMHDLFVSLPKPLQFVAQVLFDVVGIFSNLFREIRSGVQTGLAEAGPRFAELATITTTQLLPALGDLYNALSTLLIPILQKVGPIFREYYAEAIPAFATALVALVTAITKGTAALADFFRWLDSGSEGANLTKTALIALGGTVAGLWALERATSGLFSAIDKAKGAATAARSTFSALNTVLNPLAGSTGQVSKGLAGIVSKSVTVTINGVKEAAEQVGSIARGIGGLADKAFKVTVSGIDDAISKIDELVRAAAERTVTVKVKIEEDAGGIQQQAGNFASKFASSFAGSLAGGLAAAGIGALIAAGITISLPVVLIAVGALAVAGAAFLVFKFRDEIAAGAGAIAEGLKSALTTAVQQAPEALGAVGGVLAAALVLAIAGPFIVGFRIGEWVGEAVGNAAPVIARAGADIASSIISGLGDLAGGVAGVFGDVAGAIADLNIPGRVSDGFKAIPGLISDLPQLTADIILQIPGLIIDLPRLTADIILQIPGLIAELPGQVASVFQSVVTGATDLMGTLIGSTVDIFGQIAGAIINSPVAQAVGDVMGQVLEGFRAGWNFVNELTGGELNRIVDLIRGLPGLLGDVGQLLLGVGRDLIQGFINGVNELWDTATNFVRNLFDGILKGVSSVLGLGSPSRIMRDYGVNFIQGFLDGTGSLAPKLAAKMEEMGKAAFEKFKSTLSGIGGAIGDVAGGVADFLGGGSGGGGATGTGTGGMYESLATQILSGRQNADVFMRMLRQESGNFDPNVVEGRVRSSAGAIGIAQFMPGTAAGIGINPLDPRAAVDAGYRYFMQQVAYFGGDVAKGIAAYNAGAGNVESAVRRGGANWRAFLPAETQLYLRIMGYKRGGKHTYGPFVVGEEGPEIGFLGPDGMSILPHGTSKALAGIAGIPGFANGAGVGDIERFLEELKAIMRMLPRELLEAVDRIDIINPEEMRRRFGYENAQGVMQATTEGRGILNFSTALVGEAEEWIRHVIAHEFGHLRGSREGGDFSENTAIRHATDMGFPFIPGAGFNPDMDFGPVVAQITDLNALLGELPPTLDTVSTSMDTARRSTMDFGAVGERLKPTVRENQEELTRLDAEIARLNETLAYTDPYSEQAASIQQTIDLYRAWQSQIQAGLQRIEAEGAALEASKTAWDGILQTRQEFLSQQQLLNQYGEEGAQVIASVMEAFASGTAQAGSAAYSNLEAFISGLSETLGPQAQEVGNHLRFLFLEAFNPANDEAARANFLQRFSDMFAELNTQTREAATLTAETFATAFGEATAQMNLAERVGRVFTPLFEALDAQAEEASVQNVQRVGQIAAGIEKQLGTLPEVLRGPIMAEWKAAWDEFFATGDMTKLEDTAARANNALNLIPRDFSKLTPEVQKEILGLIQQVNDLGVTAEEAGERIGKAMQGAAQASSGPFAEIDRELQNLIKLFQEGAISAEEFQSRWATAQSSANRIATQGKPQGQLAPALQAIVGRANGMQGGPINRHTYLMDARSGVVWGEMSEGDKPEWILNDAQKKSLVGYQNGNVFSGQGMATFPGQAEIGEFHCLTEEQEEELRNLGKGGQRLVPRSNPPQNPASVNKPIDMGQAEAYAAYIMGDRNQTTQAAYAAGINDMINYERDQRAYFVGLRQQELDDAFNAELKRWIAYQLQQGSCLWLTKILEEGAAAAYVQWNPSRAAMFSVMSSGEGPQGGVMDAILAAYGIRPPGATRSTGLDQRIVGMAGGGMINRESYLVDAKSGKFWGKVAEGNRPEYVVNERQMQHYASGTPGLMHVEGTESVMYSRFENAINRLGDRIESMQVAIDGKKAGKILTPHTSSIMRRNMKGAARNR